MRTIVVNGNVVIGDGENISKNSTIMIEDEYIVDIRKVKYLFHNAADKVIDARGGYVIPGLINDLTHGAGMGPFAMGDPKFSRERVIQNLNTHMLQGETTILNGSGFTTMTEIETTNKLHPVNVKGATTYIPKYVEVALAVGGTGLMPVHKETTVEEQVKLGAVAIGEVGGGTIFGGQGSDLSMIPIAVKKKTGKDIAPEQARALREAVIGRVASRDAFNYDKTRAVLEEIGMKDLMSVEQARQMYEDLVLKTLDSSKQSCMDAGEYAKKLNVPVIMHNAASSASVVLEVAKRIGPLMIACHSNNETFEVDEGLKVARQLKQYGARIDIYSYLKDHVTISELTLRMFQEGLVDFISTDFIGGFHDPILLCIEKAMEKGVVSLPKAIAMATSNVAKGIPKLAHRRGLIVPNMVADLAIIDADHISKVDTVMIGGRVVVEEGRVKTSCLPQTLY